jgi:ABC-type polysaccharide/polyol phosphate transport system ATPase subunit
MDMIGQFCDRVLLLDHGRKVAFGPTREVLDLYLRSSVNRV